MTCVPPTPLLAFVPVAYGLRQLVGGRSQHLDGDRGQRNPAVEQLEGSIRSGAHREQTSSRGSQRRSGESARSVVISAVSVCGSGPTASTQTFSRARCSVRFPSSGMIDGSRANR